MWVGKSVCDWAYRENRVYLAYCVTQDIRGQRARLISSVTWLRVTSHVLTSSLQEIPAGVFIPAEVSGGQRHILQAGVRESDRRNNLRYLYRGPDCLNYSPFCSE